MLIIAVFIRCLCLQVFVRRPHHPSTKCPRDKWLATKCPRDEMAGDELYLQQNGRQRKGRRQNNGDETAATKGVYTLPKLSSTLSKLEVSDEIRTTRQFDFVGE